MLCQMESGLPSIQAPLGPARQILCCSAMSWPRMPWITQSAIIRKGVVHWDIYVCLRYHVLFEICLQLIINSFPLQRYTTFLFTYMRLWLQNNTSMETGSFIKKGKNHRTDCWWAPFVMYTSLTASVHLLSRCL